MQANIRHWEVGDVDEASWAASKALFKPSAVHGLVSGVRAPCRWPCCLPPRAAVRFAGCLTAAYAGRAGLQ